MTQTMNPWPSPWTRALRVETWRSKNGNVWPHTCKKTDSIWPHTLFMSEIQPLWHPDCRKTDVDADANTDDDESHDRLIAGLTHEEVCSFEPPLFDEDDMEWGRRTHVDPQPYAVLRTLFLCVSVKLSDAHRGPLQSINRKHCCV